MPSSSMRQIPPAYVLEWMANFRKGFFSNSIQELSMASFKKAAFTFSKDEISGDCFFSYGRTRLRQCRLLNQDQRQRETAFKVCQLIFFVHLHDLPWSVSAYYYFCQYHSYFTIEKGPLRNKKSF